MVEQDDEENQPWIQQNKMDKEQQLAEYEKMMMQVHPGHQMISQNYPTIEDAHYEIKNNQNYDNSSVNIQNHFIQP